MSDLPSLPSVAAATSSVAPPDAHVLVLKSEPADEDGPSVSVSNDNDDGITIKEEVLNFQDTQHDSTNPPTSDGYDPSVWAQIFDESGIEVMELRDGEGDVRMEGTADHVMDDPCDGRRGGGVSRHDDDQAMLSSWEESSHRVQTSSATLRPFIPRPYPQALLHEPTIDPWDASTATRAYNEELLPPMVDIANSFAICQTNSLGESSATTTSYSTASETTLVRSYGSSISEHTRDQEQLRPFVGDNGSTSGSFGSTLASSNTRQSTTDVMHPSHIISFERQMDGSPFPLSKPIIRDDGVLLVGTELAQTAGQAPSPQVGQSNRIFVTNFRSFQPTQPAPFIPVQEEVRDLQWITPYTAIAAIGQDIHTLRVGDASGNRCCRLMDAVRRVHSDTIREIAVNHEADPTKIASGGYDETVVIMDLCHPPEAGPSGTGSGPPSILVTKFDACDVVSSLRWVPHGAMQVSWTTDGGDFQLADLRVRTAQLQLPLYSATPLHQMGGLYCHEYLTSHSVVLGFSTGHLALLDLRMPRRMCCYHTMTTRLGAIGEMRMSKTQSFGFFGMNGFATAQLNSSVNGFENMTQSIMPTRDDQLAALTAYKTSGDFSAESGRILAVSDNLGVVSIYNGSSSGTGRSTKLM